MEQLARPHRQGIALILALSTLLVLGVFGSMAYTMSRGATREVDVLGNHLRAMAVADAAYARIASRLCATGWAARWFRTGPFSELDVKASGGVYSSIIRDAPTATAIDPTWPGDLGQADLMVRATYNKSTVTCFWRLALNRDGLDDLLRAVPRFFMYPPDSMATGPLDPIVALIGPLVAKRQQNIAGFETRRASAAAATTAAEVAALVGPATGTVVDGVVPLGGGAERANGAYLPNAVSGALPGLSLSGPWTQVAYRQGRTGGTDGWGDRPNPGVRTYRGKDPEESGWKAWPGWSGSGFGTFGDWEGWRTWAGTKSANATRGKWPRKRETEDDEDEERGEEGDSDEEGGEGDGDD